MLNPTLRLLLPLATAAGLALGGPLAHAADAGDISGVTGEEFYFARYYQGALEHPKIQKLSESAKINAVAKDLHAKPGKLKEAVEKVGALGGDPAELALTAVKSAFEQTRVKGRVLDVLINADEPKHVVIYVRWQASTQPDVVKEASEIAHTVATKAPLVATLSLAAIHPKAPKDSKDAVWSAKIGRDRMASIQPKRIDDYADKLYKRLFEGVEEKTF